jgi:pilus assembly protein CpaE
MLTAAVAASSAESSGYLRACLQQTGLVQAVAEWGIASEQFPAPGEAVPDMVLLELAPSAEACFAFAAHLRRLRPSVCTMVCSAKEPRPEMLIEAMRNGVREFLNQPVDSQVLQGAIERLIQEHGSGEGKPEEKLVVVMGSKGGVGTTTVTVNLGVQIAQASKKRVLLLDFGRPIGHASLMLDLQPRFTVVDAVDNLQRLDAHFLAGLLTRHGSGLEVLAGTSNAELWAKLSARALSRIVNVAQGANDFVLMDLGSVYPWEWNVALKTARMVIVVTEANVPGLWTLEKQLTALAASGIDPHRFRVVVNRWHKSDEEALKSVEKRIKCSVYARLPNDFRQVNESINLGKPLSRNHSDPLTTRYRQIAGEVAGLPAEDKAKGKSLFGLFAPR